MTTVLFCSHGLSDPTTESVYTESFFKLAIVFQIWGKGVWRNGCKYNGNIDPAPLMKCVDYQAHEYNLAQRFLGYFYPGSLKLPQTQLVT